jgi:Holliday junction DNA helicase RuvA
MFAKLTGVVDSVREDSLVLDVGGVGYLVFASRRTLSNVGNTGDAASLLIETNIREDHIHLFGFLDVGEKDLFKLLQSVQGVGAKVALGILSTLTTEELLTALVSGDKAAVSKANGVGPKLAARIVNELKGKTIGVATSGLNMPANTAGFAQTSDQENIRDAISALTNLGYSASEAHIAVQGASQKADGGVEVLIPLALKELSK